MNKILFGFIGLLFIGVIGAGIVAMRPDTNTALVETPVTQEILDPVVAVPDSSEDSSAASSSHTPSSTPTPTPHPAPTPTPAPESQPGVYTMAQVATHNSEASCYTAIEGSVYDVTSFIRRHPGGSRAILSLCGRNGTAAFEGQHGGQKRPASELASFKIGRLSS